MGLDERIGERFLRAGPGYGGSCFPKDTKALVNTANKFKTNLTIVKSVIKSNKNRHKHLINRILSIMKNNLNKKTITFLGVTFKSNTDDMRESPSLDLIPLLLKKGAKINYYEPTGLKDNFKNLKNVKFYSKLKESCKKSDLIIIHTDWNEFKQLNFKSINKIKGFKVFDMRNLYSTFKMKKNKINYFSIGT